MNAVFAFTALSFCRMNSVDFPLLLKHGTLALSAKCVLKAS